MGLRARIVKAGLKEVVGAQGRGAAWAPPQELPSLSSLGCTEASLLPSVPPDLPWGAVGCAAIRDNSVLPFGLPEFRCLSFHFPTPPSAFMWLKFPLLPTRLLPSVHIHSAQL